MCPLGAGSDTARAFSEMGHTGSRMTTTTKGVFLAATLLACLAGCTPLPMNAVSSRELALAPRVSRPAGDSIGTPLYLVLDPRAVPDTAIIEPTGARSELRVTDIQEFVRTHLRTTLSRYFDRVEVVAPNQVPPGGHVALVRISHVGLTGHRNGEIYGQLGWSFSLRSAAGDQPVFRFSETATGETGIAYGSHGAETIASTYRVALEHLVHALGERRVPERLLASEQRTFGVASRPPTAL